MKASLSIVLFLRTAFESHIVSDRMRCRPDDSLQRHEPVSSSTNNYSDNDDDDIRNNGMNIITLILNYTHFFTIIIQNNVHLFLI